MQVDRGTIMDAIRIGVKSIGIGESRTVTSFSRSTLKGGIFYVVP